jgi:anti-sigma factor RsiW
MSLYLDGLLERDQVVQLQAHLADCEACREEWAAMRSLSDLLDGAPLAEPAPGLAARVMQRLQQREARQRRLYSILGVLLGSAGLWVAAGLIACVVCFVVWRAPLQILWTNAGLPLARNTLSALAVLFEAMLKVTDELSRRPTGSLVLSYAVLALALTALWTRVVFQRAPRLMA